jgi:hypothetical protein
MSRNRYRLFVLAALVAGCERRALDMSVRDIPGDPGRLAVARSQISAASAAASEISAATRPCTSPVPAYPVCERENGQLLLLAGGNYGGAGSKVDALLWVLAGKRPQLWMTLWHFDSLGTDLGHGWYHVVAVSHID